MVDESLDELFWGVARRLRHRNRETFAGLGVTPGHARALGVLAREGGVRPSVLAERLRIAPRSGTEVVDALEERGLVARSPDPDDRRATLVTLTAEGERVAAAVRQARRDDAQAVFGTLPEGDRAELSRILRGLSRSGG